MQRQKRTFKAKDANDRVYTITEYADITLQQTYGKDEWIEGENYLLTELGQHVNKVGARRYVIVETGAILRSDDENAA